MSNWFTKVYVVQKFDKEGNAGDVIAAKLTYGAAHEVAKAFAPAKVITITADKTPLPNSPEYVAARQA